MEEAFAEARLSEEPGAIRCAAARRIRAGRGRVTALSTVTADYSQARFVPVYSGLLDKLPNGPEKHKLARDPEQAEQQFNIAEADAAKALGHLICHCDFPGQIMLLTEESHYGRPKCGREQRPPSMSDLDLAAPSK